MLLEDGRELDARPNPLRAELQRTEHEKRLAQRLPGRQLPDVELAISRGGTVPLLAHVEGLKVVYFAPGEPPATTDSPTPTERQHRGFAKHAEDFARLRAGVLGIASKQPTDLAHEGLRAGVRYLLLADPDLLVGRALGLTTEDGESEPYRRVVLVTLKGVILKMLRALPDSQAGNSARGALAWLEATGAR